MNFPMTLRKKYLFEFSRPLTMAPQLGWHCTFLLNCSFPFFSILNKKVVYQRKPNDEYLVNIYCFLLEGSLPVIDGEFYCINNFMPNGVCNTMLRPYC